MGTLLLTPYSRTCHSLSTMSNPTHYYAGGSVQLNPADPSGPPLLDIGFYTSPADILMMRQAVLKMLRFVSAPVWKKNLGSPVGGIATVIDSDKGNGINMTVLDQFLRSTSFSIHHATGTAAISAVGDPWGVVDPDLQVKGLKGLRVVDASVLVTIVELYVLCEIAEHLTLSAIHTDIKRPGTYVCGGGTGSGYHKAGILRRALSAFHL